MIGERYGVDLTDVPLVGDSLRDLQAGAAAGCQPHLVRTGKGARLDDARARAMLRAGARRAGACRPGRFAEHLIQRRARASAATPARPIRASGG